MIFVTGGDIGDGGTVCDFVIGCYGDCGSGCDRVGYCSGTGGGDNVIGDSDDDDDDDYINVNNVNNFLSVSFAHDHLNSLTNGRFVSQGIIMTSSSLVFSPKAGFGRNQSPVRRPVWLWHTAF